MIPKNLRAAVYAVGCARHNLDLAKLRLHQLRQSTPLEPGVELARIYKGGYTRIDVKVDGEHIGFVRDLSNPHGSQFHVAPCGPLTSSRNEAVWILLEQYHEANSEAA